LKKPRRRRRRRGRGRERRRREYGCERKGTTNPIIMIILVILCCP
jgi:hypothetical protein